MKFICYPKCTTCQKAQRWLEENNISFEIRHIKDENPSADELRMWWKMSGLSLSRFFNTSGILYRSMELKDKLADMSDNEKIALLATDGMLVKRPILVGDEKVFVGFNEKQWSELLQK